MHKTPEHRTALPLPTTALVLCVLAFAGAVSVFAMLDARIINVVTYRVEPNPALRLWGPYIPYVIAVLALCVVFFHRLVGRTTPPETGLLSPQRPTTPDIAPQCLMISAAVVWLITWSVALPDSITTLARFAAVCTTIVGFGWSIDRLGVGLTPSPRIESAGTWALPLLLLAIIAATVWHAREQVHLWKHFMLGYADFGFFTTELEHCLPWKDVGPLRFSDTRLGYHSVFMFYVLVPFYAVFRSPVFLMVIGPLVLNLAAIPFYHLAKARSGSSLIGLIVGLAWLALPSVSRLPYSNTYGFQSIYIAVPWLAMCFCFAMRGRWTWSHVCLAGALLSEETVCGVAFGWGLYLLLSRDKRRTGLAIVVIAVAYLLLCTTIIIPHFDRTGTYTRLRLFGELIPAAIPERFLRPRALLYLLALTGPMLLGLCRCGKMLVVALPTLALVLMMQEPDYLNLKYWHHASVLVPLFTAAAVGATGSRRLPDRIGTESRRASLGPPLALLIAALLFHQILGNSPFAQSWRVYATAPVLTEPHPGRHAVRFVRTHYSPEEYVVIATDRIAAHFIDYRMVHLASGFCFAEVLDGPHLFVFDRTDRWKQRDATEASQPLLECAREAGFTPAYDDGRVIVLSYPPK
ncbi:MAG: DUF2079 domain-containing protein [Phycisphaerae bacterium]